MAPDKTVMVVDDDRDILTVATRGLERAGFRVHGFADPILALQHVEGGCENCTVMVADIRMPAMSGFQLVRRVKELRPDLKVIMMTAFEVNKPEFDAVFPSTTVDKIMQKPFPVSQLTDSVEELYSHNKGSE